MSIKQWLVGIFYIVLMVSVGAFVLMRMNEVQKMSFLTIQGGIESSLAVPVFAQFTAAQTLNIQGDHTVSQLIIPLYFPAHAQPITISLYNHGTLINWWKTPVTNTTAAEIAYVHLDFISPMDISGDAELRLDGSNIAYDDKAVAPGFFIESQDAAYPYGNYRIAANEKHGDIAMQLIEQKTKYELVMEEFQKDHLGMITRLLTLAPIIFLLMLLPSSILRTHRTTPKG